MRVRKVVFIWPKSTHCGTAIVSLVSGYAWDDGSSDSRLFVLHSFSFNTALLRLSLSLSLNQIHPHNFHSEPDRKNCGLATLSPREPDARSLSLNAQKSDLVLLSSRTILPLFWMKTRDN